MITPGLDNTRNINAVFTSADHVIFREIRVVRYLVADRENRPGNLPE
jgi:hypothetical protein